MLWTEQAWYCSICMIWYGCWQACFLPMQSVAEDPTTPSPARSGHHHWAIAAWCWSRAAHTRHVLHIQGHSILMPVWKIKTESSYPVSFGLEPDFNLILRYGFSIPNCHRWTQALGVISLIWNSLVSPLQETLIDVWLQHDKQVEAANSCSDKRNVLWLRNT